MRRLARHFRVSRNARGEWSLADLVRGYRICRYNHAAHGGIHIHDALDGPVVASVDIANEAEAELVLRAYAARHDSFDLQAFRRVIAEWKSESKND